MRWPLSLLFFLFLSFGHINVNSVTFDNIFMWNFLFCLTHLIRYTVITSFYYCFIGMFFSCSFFFSNNENSFKSRRLCGAWWWWWEWWWTGWVAGTCWAYWVCVCVLLLLLQLLSGGSVRLMLLQFAATYLIKYI